MNVTELIKKAYKYAQIVGEGVESVDSDQLVTGLDLLNIIIEDENIDSQQIPLISSQEFTLPTGQQEIELSDWTTIIKCRFLIGSVYWDIQPKLLVDYLNMSRIKNVSGLPYIGYARRTEGGIILYVYFSSSDNYLMTVWGYKKLSTVDFGEELTDIALFMQNYLMFKLAIDLRAYNQMEFDLQLSKRISYYKDKFRNIKERNPNTYKNTVGKKSLNYGDGSMSLYRGYVP